MSWCRRVLSKQIQFTRNFSAQLRFSRWHKLIAAGEHLPVFVRQHITHLRDVLLPHNSSPIVGLSFFAAIS